MNIIDWVRGYSIAKEFQRVYHKDGSIGPVHAVVNYYDSCGKKIRTGFGGRLTNRERVFCEENPEVVQKSPFSYTPYSGIEEKLPTEFAKTVSAILDSEL